MSQTTMAVVSWSPSHFSSEERRLHVLLKVKWKMKKKEVISSLSLLFFFKNIKTPKPGLSI